MQSFNKKSPSDIIILFESSAMIGVCFDTILENYLKPLLQFFYGMPISDELGLMKDLSGVLFSAITYKSIDCLPQSICSFIQPTSHARMFCDKIEKSIEFSLVEERAHMAEGFALALDTFEDLDNRRRGNKIERVPSTRHIILVASQGAYEEIPIIESNNYRGLKFEEILQSLQKFQVNLSIISPKYSPELIKLYEKVNNFNGNSSNSELKLDRVNNFTYFVLLHNSIHLIDYEAQQKQIQQQQQQLLQQQQQIQSQAQQIQTQPQSNLQETFSNIKMETSEPLPSNVMVSQNAQQNLGYQPIPSQTSQQQGQQQQHQQQPGSQQSQQFQQFSHQQKLIHATNTNIQQAQNQNYPMGMQQQQQQQQQPQMPNQQELFNPQQQQLLQQQQQLKQAQIQQQQQQQHQQQQQQPILSTTPQNQQPIQTMQQQQVQQNPQMPRSASNIGKPQQLPSQPVQVTMPNIRQLNPQIIQSQTPPIVTVPINQNYNQMNIAQQRFPQQQAQQPPQQGQQTAAYPYGQQQQQGKPVQIWDGLIEWQEKDRQNPNTKLTHTLKAALVTLSVIDQNTGQLMSEISRTLVQDWPQKITLQLLGRQILDILSPHCQPPTRNLYVITDQNSQDLKNALNIGGALINLANIPNQDIKILLVTVQGNDIVCKIPSDQNKFLNALKLIIQRQKQQQQRLQPPPQQQQQQQQMVNPNMIQGSQPGMMQQQPGQPNQVLIQSTAGGQSQMINPNQMNAEQKDLRHLLIGGQNQQMGMGQQKVTTIQQQPGQNWINVNQQQQQQQQQQPQQQIYITNQQQGGMVQQQQQPKQQQNYQFGGYDYS